MKSKFFVSAALLCVLLAGGAVAKGESKITVVKTDGTHVDGATNVTETMLGECIVSLPSISELVADVSENTEFLKEINGEAGKNDHVKVYTASVRVSYKVRQRILIIITQNTLEGQPPVTREEERTIMKTSSLFVSDPGGGNMFAGRSNRRHYYSTAEAAAESAKKRAEVWIKQQQNVLCSAGQKK